MTEGQYIGRQLRSIALRAQHQIAYRHVRSIHRPDDYHNRKGWRKRPSADAEHLKLKGK